MLRERLGAAWRAFRGAGNPAPARSTLQALEARVSELETVQVTREIQWQETRAALDRMVKRMGALDQRARERAEQAEENGAHVGRQTRDQLRELMRKKGLLKGE